ncbi:Regulatory protein AfsR [Streptomyces sp. RB5]|uniref:Regulatory protein AfsR n=1 Tax=Streptomyces smaragdinus TaxID=2585196 RepID=A0A7K0CSB3_9ACTN|nr:tetratricopeptide repeat protein [Streptomyces smaragdinus]MQY16359.1 Regulatory protein AfsR [Streptomyces smaragdinus]
MTESALALLGRALKGARESRRVSQRELARRIGYGHSALSPYEQGRRIPPTWIVRQYESELGLGEGTLGTLLNRALRERAGDHRPDVRELPPWPADFAGRRAELARLDDIAAHAADAPHPTVVVLHGLSGVGKTTLALRAAHRTAFGHQWWVELHRVHAGVRTPVPPAPALRRLLGRLGVPEPRIPRDAADLARMYRSELAGQPALLLLDDARDAAQVRPFIPGSGPALVLVTSLNPLDGLDGAIRLPLTPLPAPESAGLLERIAGAGRLTDDPAAAARLVDGCGGFPLTLRVVGARLAAHPDWPLAHFAAQLRDRDERLGPVSAALDRSYRELAPADRTLLRRLALLPGTGTGAGAAAVLLGGVPPREAADALARLAGAGMLTPTARPGRYRPHDLVRQFAEQRLAEEEDERETVTTALHDWLLTTALAAALAVSPARGPYDGGREAALTWLDDEAEALLAVLEGLSAVPAEPSLSELLTEMVWYYDLGCRWDELARCARAIRRLATTDTALAACALNALGYALAFLGRPADAIACHEEALELARTDGNWREEGDALSKLGLCRWETDRFPEAVAYHEQDLRLRERHADPIGTATALSHLGYALRMTGRHDEALATLERALTACATARDDRAMAMTRWRLAMTLADTARWTDAEAQARRALTYFEATRDTWGPGGARLVLGRVHLGRGALDEAVTELDEAIRVFGDTGDRFRQSQTLRLLASVHAASSRPEAATDCRRAAARLLPGRDPSADGGGPLR